MQFSALSLQAILKEISAIKNCEIAVWKKVNEKILGAQLIMLGASVSKEKVKSLTVPRLFVIFSFLLLLQSCD